MVWPQCSRVFARPRFRSTRSGVVVLACLFLMGCNGVETVTYVDKDTVRFKQDGKNDVVQIIELNLGCNSGYFPRAEHQVGHIVVLCEKAGAVEKSQADRAEKQSEAKIK